LYLRTLSKLKKIKNLWKKDFKTSEKKKIKIKEVENEDKINKNKEKN
jgi:hypothetical protein